MRMTADLHIDSVAFSCSFTPLLRQPLQPLLLASHLQLPPVCLTLGCLCFRHFLLACSWSLLPKALTGFAPAMGHSNANDTRQRYWQQRDLLVMRRIPSALHGHSTVHAVPASLSGIRVTIFIHPGQISPGHTDKVGQYECFDMT